MFRSLILMGAMIGLMAAANPALAQMTFDPRKDARMQAGPFYLTPTLTVDNVGVDSNVFNDGTGPKPDFTATVNPGAKVWLPIARRMLITTTPTVGFVYFKSYANQRSINPGVGVTGEVYLRRLTFSVSGSTGRSSARPNNEIDARARQATHGGGGAVSLALLSKLSVSVSANQNVVKFDPGAVFAGASLADTLNRTERVVGVSARRTITSLTTVVVSSESQRDRFEFSPIRNSDSVRAIAGFEFKPKALISGDAKVGFRRFNVQDSRVPDFSGLVAASSVTYRATDGMQFALDWNRDIQYSIQAQQPYYVSNDVAPSVRRQIAGKFDAIVMVDRDVNSYRSLAGSPEVRARRDTTLRYSLDVGYRVNRVTRVGFAVSHLARSSSDTSNDYRGLRAGLTMKYGF